MKKVTLPVNFKDYNFVILAKKEQNAALKLRYLAMSYIAMGKTVIETATLVHKSSRMVHRWISVPLRNYIKDDGRPIVIGLQEQVTNHPKLLL